MRDLPYSHKVRLDAVPPGGLAVHLSPDSETRAALARHVDVLAVHSLEADLTVTHEGEGACVTGRLAARIRQTSVVSLEPFDSDVAERFEVHFAPEEAIAKLSGDEEELDPETDPPDVLVDGTVDLGALVSEFLSLGIDPYPRREGEVFEVPEEGGPAAISPFAALARLKDES